MDRARPVAVDHLVHAAPSVTRQRKRRNDATLCPITHIRPVFTSAIHTAPKFHPLVAWRRQRIAGMLPVLLPGGVWNAPAPKSVPPRARLHPSWRTRHHARATIIHCTRLRRRQRVYARRDR